MFCNRNRIQFPFSLYPHYEIQLHAFLYSPSLLTTLKSTAASPVLVGQHALSSIQWIYIVDEQLAVCCGHQQSWKLLDPAKNPNEYPFHV